MFSSSCDHHGSRPTRASDSRDGLTTRRPPQTCTRALTPSCRAFRLFAMVIVLGWCAGTLHARAGQQEKEEGSFNQAKRYETAGDYASAEGVYQRILASDPVNCE